MKYNLYMTDTAKQDLSELGRRLFNRSSDIHTAHDTAYNAVYDLSAAVYDTLRFHPEQGDIPDDRIMKSLGIRFVTANNLKLLYRFHEEDKIVYVLAVFDLERKDQRHLKFMF